MSTKQDDQIEIENVIQPGRTTRVNREKFEAVRRAYLKVLPSADPGMTPAQVRARLTGEVPEELFPGGAKLGWWAKAVQLDLEAKGVIERAPAAPVRLRKANRG